MKTKHEIPTRQRGLEASDSRVGRWRTNVSTSIESGSVPAPYATSEDRKRKFVGVVAMKWGSSAGSGENQTTPKSPMLLRRECSSLDCAPWQAAPLAAPK